MIHKNRGLLSSCSKDMNENSILIEKALSRQKPGGYWYKPGNFYVYAKYKGTAWTVILLAELGADGNDERIRRACDFLLTWSQHRESGGFAFHGTADSGGESDCIIPCLTGNMVYSLIRLGMLDDPRVQRGIDWITTYQRFDDGECKAPKGFPYQNQHCWGRHTCMNGVVTALRALAEIPPRKRSPQERQAIIQAVEFILIHRLYRLSHDPSRVANPGWLKLGWPHMANIDILEMLAILQELGIRDERMIPALEELVKMRGWDGFWINQAAKEGRMVVKVEKQGQPSPRITQLAVGVLHFMNEIFPER
jgi:hypothetical protein